MHTPATKKARKFNNFRAFIFVRRSTAGHAFQSTFPEDAFRVDGAARAFSWTADSGNTVNGDGARRQPRRPVRRGAADGSVRRAGFLTFRLLQQYFLL